MGDLHLPFSGTEPGMGPDEVDSAPAMLLCTCIAVALCFVLWVRPRLNSGGPQPGHTRARWWCRRSDKQASRKLTGITTEPAGAITSSSSGEATVQLMTSPSHTPAVVVRHAAHQSSLFPRPPRPAPGMSLAKVLQTLPADYTQALRACSQSSPASLASLPRLPPLTRSSTEAAENRRPVVYTSRLHRVFCAGKVSMRRSRAVLYCWAATAPDLYAMLIAFMYGSLSCCLFAG